MQIRLTVLAPRGGQTASGGREFPVPGSTGPAPGSAGRACDVLVTAPTGTALAAVASGLAAAVAGPDVSGPVALYAGRERLDAQRRTLGEPPLVDGAVLSLQFPGEDGPSGADASAQLHVVAGPDAGGVHLLHGGRISIGRSAEADVPLDDPDVSRLHCEVTVADDGRVTVADLGSTNGTALDGRVVGPDAVGLPPGALLRLGESTLRLTPGDRTPPLATAPDGEGHLRVPRAGALRPEESPAGSAPPAEGRAEGHRFEDPARGAPPSRPRGGVESPAHSAYVPGSPASDGSMAGTPSHGTYTGVPDRVPSQYGSARTARPGGSGRGTGEAAMGEYGPRERGGIGPVGPRADVWHGDTGGDSMHQRAVDGRGAGAPDTSDAGVPVASDAEARDAGALDAGALDAAETHSRRSSGRAGASGSRGPGGGRKKGIGAWARRLKGDREEPVEEPPSAPLPAAAPPAAPLIESWPDPAAVLLTALGPGPRLWERAAGHPESLVLRLGTADRDGLPAVPVTVGLREAGSLGLAGPRARLEGAARWAVAQLAALHSPADLEIVLISTDRARSLEERTAAWAWLGWLPHLRPAHGQDCRLLVAYDRDQAAARTAELTRRLDDGLLGPGWPSADGSALSEAAARYEGPRTVVIVDGDPGSAALRETTARLAGAGWSSGIHLIALAETPAATPLSTVAATYETACAASLPFRECGAVGLLSGDVATALRVLRTAGGLPAGHGTLAAVDAVSAAWAQRFGRALAPLRTEGSPIAPGRATALPRTARLLDELGLARATPASLMARWASAGETDRAAAGFAVLGAGPHGPLAVDLTVEGPHLLIEGPPGSGRTELLRSVAASLAAADRPDRLGLLLVDGAGGERGEGLAVCTDLPHVTEHLVASDPVRMREFAQALGAELKRRAEMLGDLGFAEWHTRRRVADRMVGPRQPSAGEQSGTARGTLGPSPRAALGTPARGALGPSPNGDIDSPTSRTLRLRPGGRTKTAAATADGSGTLPRLVVLVDDFDALVAPALGSTGRPAAGSVVRALEAVARDGERLGVHLVAASARPDRTADTELTREARLRVALDAPPVSAGPEDPLPGRGRLAHPDGRVTPFQSGRVTGRIPRTATLRPTVVPLDWERMGDPPTRRPVRELGNGPTDLALLASALERAARSVDAEPLAPLTPAHRLG